MKTKEERERRKRHKELVKRKLKAQRKANKHEKGYYLKLFFKGGNYENQDNFSAFEIFIIFFGAIGELISLVIKSIFKNHNSNYSNYDIDYSNYDIDYRTDYLERDYTNILIGIVIIVPILTFVLYKYAGIDSILPIGIFGEIIAVLKLILAE